MSLQKYHCFAVLLLLISGCGPMTGPMAARLDDEQQKRIDQGWDAALTTLDKLDHQNWLDVFVTTGVYQFGVDKLYFRSEKRFSGGLAVMMIHFDRTKPDDDRFEVELQDSKGKVLRREQYRRDEVLQTYRDLGEHTAGDPSTAEGAAKQSERKLRLNRIQQLFPETAVPITP